MAGNTEAPQQGAVDYKTLFLGSCLLVSILGGALWNLWNQSASDQANDNARINTAQWERLRDLHDAIIKHAGRLERLEERAADTEARLRVLEREHNGHRR